jgi:hypothetical protein
MTTRLPLRPVYLGLGFGHTAVLEQTPTGGRVVIRGPRGVAPVIIDITMAEDGPSVRARDELLWAPPPTGLRTAVEADAPSASGVRPVSSFLPAPEPAPAPAPPPRTRLTLLEYATLRAACVNAPPEQLPALRMRYLLDEAGDTAETEGWLHRFKQDPTLFAAYKHYFQLFRSGTAASPAVAAIGK